MNKTDKVTMKIYSKQLTIPKTCIYKADKSQSTSVTKQQVDKAIIVQ